MRKALEKEIQDQILIALGTMPGMAIWRSAVGNGWVRRKDGFAPMRFGGMPGQADILGCYHGRFIAIEVKTATGRQRPEQRDWQHAIEMAGGVYILARSVADALDGVARIAIPTQVLHRHPDGAIDVAAPLSGGQRGNAQPEGSGSRPPLLPSNPDAGGKPRQV